MSFELPPPYGQMDKPVNNSLGVTTWVLTLVRGLTPVTKQTYPWYPLTRCWLNIQALQILTFFLFLLRVSCPPLIKKGGICQFDHLASCRLGHPWAVGPWARYELEMARALEQRSAVVVALPVESGV